MEKEKLSQQEYEKLQSILGGLSSIQKNEMFELLKKDKKERKDKEKQLKKLGKMPKEDISVHKEEIIKYLKKLVNVEHKVEFMGHTGKKVSIELPAIGEFEGYKTTFFVGNEQFFRESYKREIKPNKELVEKMCRYSDVCNLLQKLKKYVKELHKYIYKSEVDIDENIDFRHDLESYNKSQKEHKLISDTCDILSSLGMLGHFYLNDEVDTFSGKMPIVWKSGSFDLDRDDNGADLLLKMSD